MTRQILRNDGIKCREDDPWDVFIPDEDECDPNPEPGDFWSDDDPLFSENCFDSPFDASGQEALSCCL